MDNRPRRSSRRLRDSTQINPSSASDEMSAEEPASHYPANPSLAGSVTDHVVVRPETSTGSTAGLAAGPTDTVSRPAINSVFALDSTMMTVDRPETSVEEQRSQRAHSGSACGRRRRDQQPEDQPAAQPLQSRDPACSRVPALDLPAAETAVAEGCSDADPAAVPCQPPQAGSDTSDRTAGLRSTPPQPPSKHTAPAKAPSDGPDCAICLQSCVHPVRLPCQHVFCFLCAKGAAKTTRRCAMCRTEFPGDYLEHPELLNAAVLERELALQDGFQWFYEGWNGWWKYDERTSAELEAAFSGGQKRAELLVAGFRYVVDFDAMLQVRRSDPARRRRVKRDLASVAKKGVAGIRLAAPPREVDTAAAGATATQRLAVTPEPESERERTPEPELPASGWSQRQDSDSDAL